jgi:branched-chain amino acid transport system permease protein
MGYIKNIKSTFKLKHCANYLVIAAFLILAIILKDAGALSRSAVGLFSRIAYSVILAVSLNLVVGFLGELSLGHAGFMCVGAYIGCLCANILHSYIASNLLVLILAMLIGGFSAAIFGFIIGLPALRLKGDYLAIVTLAFGEIVRNVCKNLEIFGGAKGLGTTKYDANSLFIVAFIVVILVLFFIQNLIRSKHGRAITAIRDNEIAARAMGINVTFYKLLVFVVSAFFAGIAGVIYGHYTTPVLPSFFSYNYSIEILVMVVLGGLGNINGSIISAVLITYINFLLQNFFSGDLAALKYMIYAIILILMIMYNNAPMFRPLHEKLTKLSNRVLAIFRRSANDPNKVKDDAAAWNRIDTKIKMDELLTVDVQKTDAMTPDAPKKGEQ